ncbi:hypothetical protein Pfra02_36760 [Pseudomonas fragi]|nr:hypothetical protein Pfra02_36760 [Pseudomonas fragi]
MSSTSPRGKCLHFYLARLHESAQASNAHSLWGCEKRLSTGQVEYGPEQFGALASLLLDNECVLHPRQQAIKRR